MTFLKIPRQNFDQVLLALYINLGKIVTFTVTYCMLWKVYSVLLLRQESLKFFSVDGSCCQFLKTILYSFCSHRQHILFCFVFQQIMVLIFIHLTAYLATLLLSYFVDFSGVSIQVIMLPTIMTASSFPLKSFYYFFHIYIYIIYFTYIYIHIRIYVYFTNISINMLITVEFQSELLWV